MRVDRPDLVIHVELGCHRHELHVRFPEGVERTHVAPVCLLTGVRVAKRVGIDPVVFDDGWNNVAAKVVLGSDRIGILDDLFVEELGIEHVVAHRREANVRLAGYGIRMLGFFGELYDAAGLVDGHDAELAGRFLQRHLETADGHVRVLFRVRGEECAVVHLVDVIAREDQHEPRVVRTEDVEILVNGVGRAAVPFAAYPLRRRQDLHEFALPCTRLEPGPALHQVPDQRMCLVLGQYADAADTRVDAVGERKIDDPELAAEIQGGLGAPAGEFVQSRPLAARENQRQRLPREPAYKTCVIGGAVFDH